jgi:hypothetical protein
MFLKYGSVIVKLDKPTVIKEKKESIEIQEVNKTK